MSIWPQIRMKYLVGINERSLAEDELPTRKFRYIDISTVGRGFLVSNPICTSFEDAPSRARRLVQTGDTIVSTVRTYLRAVWPVSGDAEDLVVSTGFAVLTPRYIEPKFLGWWAQGNPFIEAVVARSVGVSYPAINASEIGDLYMPVPPVDVQRAIADYLDTETARIDTLIAKKRRMIDLLEERVNAQVSGYIRRSPLAGEGEIEVVPIRRVLTKLERWADGGNMVTAFRDGEVTTREARNREGFTNAWTETVHVQQVEVGDVVIHGLDGFSGAIGDARTSGVCSPVYHVCIPKQGDGTFYGRMLRQLAIKGYLGNFAISTRERAVDFRNWDLFGRIPVPLVPTDEQRAIGDEIRKIRPLRDRITASEALALERRQALITAAVTGKLEISVPETVA